jgi:hypothetical protein
MAVMGSPHGIFVRSKQAYHVSGPLPFCGPDQLAKTKVKYTGIGEIKPNQSKIFPTNSKDGFVVNFSQYL